MNLPRDQRLELEETWRSKLQSASIRYQAATERYRRMLEEQSEEIALMPASTDAVVRALQEESEARVEYGRILRMFTDLTMYDRFPDGESPAAPGRR